MFFARIKYVAAALLISCVGTSEVRADSTYVFSSFDTTNNADFGFLGAVVALNGDIGTDGVLFRISALHGSYSYDLGGVDNDVDVSAVGAMIGYQTFLDHLRVSAYVGVEHRDADLSIADRSNLTQGSKTGAVGQLEIATTHGTPVYLSAIGSYSGAFGTYFTRGRIGYDFGGLTLGPELLALGDDGFEQIRYGAFVDVRVPGFSNVSIGLSGGGVDATSKAAANTNFRSDDDYYAHVDVSMAF